MKAQEKNLVQLLIEAVYWVDAAFQKKLADSGLSTISRAQTNFFVQLRGGNDSPVEIARALGVSKQAVHKTIKDLVAAGFIELKADPNDGRAKRVVPTAAGVALGLEANKMLEEVEQLLASHLDTGAVVQLRNILSDNWGEPS